MKSNKKGFTIVELFATIIILGLLVTLGYIGVKTIIERGNNSYYNSQEKMLLLAGKDYFADYKSKLPKKITQTASVTLETLVNEKYIDPIKDKNEIDCNGGESTVVVQKTTDTEYQYYTTLICTDYETVGDKAKPVIEFLPNKKSSTNPITVEMKITDNEGINSYRYVIKKDGENYKDSGYLNYTGTIKINLEEKGIYEITGYAIDTSGNMETKQSGKYSIYKGIDCAQVKFTSETKKETWINKNVTIKVSMPSNTYKWEYSTRVNGGTYQKGGNYIGSNSANLILNKDGKNQLKIVAYDEFGNSCTATTEVYYIDKTAPTCVSSGGNPNWTNGNRILKGTCSDKGGSGCVSDVTKLYDKNTNSTTETPGIVKDKAGNSTTCPANQTVKIDKTAPTCTSSGGSSSWTNKNITITGSCNDSGGSGCVSDASKSYSENTNLTNLSPGTVKDNAGNIAICPANQTVKIDKTAPTCTSSGGSSSWTNGNRTLKGTCSDSGGSGCVSNVTRTINWDTNSTNLSPGVVKDNAGNSTTCPANQTVKIDKTPPTCTSSGGSSSWTNGNRTLKGSCSDNGGSGCVSDVTATYSTNTNLTNLSPGIVKDNVGNITTCPANQTVKIDKTAPTCSISKSGTVGDNGWYKEKNVTLSLSKSDEGDSGIASYGLTSSSTTNYNGKTTGSQSDTAGVTWYGFVKDSAGNTASCNSGSFKVDTYAYTPTATAKKNGSITCNETTGQKTETVTCSGSGKVDFQFDNTSYDNLSGHYDDINWFMGYGSPCRNNSSDPNRAWGVWLYNSGSYSITGKGCTNMTFKVKSRDQAGNISKELIVNWDVD